jgi:hypothetical protein
MTTQVGCKIKKKSYPNFTIYKPLLKSLSLLHMHCCILGRCVMLSAASLFVVSIYISLWKSLSHRLMSAKYGRCSSASQFHCLSRSVTVLAARLRLLWSTTGQDWLLVLLLYKSIRKSTISLKYVKTQGVLGRAAFSKWRTRKERCGSLLI